MDPVIITPQRARIINGYAISFVRGVRIVITRIIPYPPSFKRIPARTMEPAMGASTWAFGSQRWTPYSGIFTKNAIRHPIHQILSPHEEIRRGGE